MAATPEGLFELDYWQNVFFSGLGSLFTVPRDVVRLTNSLSATYPAVVGEVNPVDFIALECIRVFFPQLYDTVRTSSEQFTGYRAPEHHEKQAAVAFHNQWLESVPESLRESIKDMMQRLFPRLESVWSNMHYSGDSLAEWRRRLRMCAGGDIFQAYFRLSLPAGAVSRADLEALLASAMQPESFAAQLRAAKEQKLPAGTSKVRAILDRLQDYVPVHMKPQHARPVTTALLQVGDELIIPGDDGGGFFSSGNEVSIARLIYHLLKKVDVAERIDILSSALLQARALRCSQRLLGSLKDEAAKAVPGEVDPHIPQDGVDALLVLWVERVETLSAAPDFIDTPAVGAILSGWSHFGPEGHATAWCQQTAQSDLGLMKLIQGFSYQVRTQGFGDFSVKTYRRVQPSTVEKYLAVDPSAERVRALLEANAVPAAYLETANAFVEAWKRHKAGLPEED